MAEPSLVYRDELTGTYNRRYLSRLFDQRWDDLVREHGQVSLVIVDLDSFKAINDTHGHLIGDAALEETVANLRNHVRQADAIVRYGGDEFILILPGAGPQDALQVAERARRSASAKRLLTSHDGREVEIPVPFSLGVASYPNDGTDGESVLQAADRRLYEDKRRRQVRVFRRHLGAAAAVTAALIGLSLVFLLPRLNGSPAPAVRQPSTTVAQERAGPSAMEAILLGQIEQLQSQLEELSRTKGEERSPAPETETARLAEMEETIRRLRAELERTRRSQGERRPEPTAPPATPTPRVSTADPARSPAPTPAPERTPPGLASPAPAPTVALLPVRLVPPELVRQVRPAYPPVARALRREAELKVEVLVDESGRVVEAKLVGADPGFGFAQAALDAARRSLFRPGTRDATAVPMVTTLRFRFVTP